MLNFQSKPVKLSNIVNGSIQTGFQVRGNIQSGHQGNYKLIQVKNTIRGLLYYIESKGLDKISIPEEKRKFMNKYLVQKNDILYLSKLNPGAFLYSDSIENTVPMAHFYILHPKASLVDSYYLCWILNHNFLKPHIQKCLKGTALPFISREALMNLKIPLPNKAVQKKIIDILKLRAREQEIQSTIDRKKNILINAILSQSCLNFQYENPPHKTNLPHKAPPTHKATSSRIVRHSRESGNPPSHPNATHKATSSRIVRHSRESGNPPSHPNATHKTSSSRIVRHSRESGNPPTHPNATHKATSSRIVRHSRESGNPPTHPNATHKATSSRIVRHSRESGNPPTHPNVTHKTSSSRIFRHSRESGNPSTKPNATHKTSSSRIVRHSRESGNPPSPLKQDQHKQTLKGDKK